MAFHPVLAAFVGNTTWFAVLLLLHVAGAIIGLGPTFAFSIIGPSIPKAGSPQGSMALMKIMLAIEEKLVVPVLVVIQLGSGVLLIFNRGLDKDFFSSHKIWLIAGILIYVAALGIATGVNAPAMKRMIAKGEKGEMDEEFGRLAKKMQMLGPVLTLLAVAIIVLMVLKPGGSCGDLYRC